MRDDADGEHARRRRPSHRATSPPTGAGCARRAGRRRAARTPDRLTDAARARRRRRAAAPASLGRALDLVADRHRRDRRRRTAADAVGGLRRRRPDQREGLPAGQVRAGRAGHPRTSTTTAGSACRSAAAAGIRAFGIDRGLPFPLADLGSAQRGPAPRRRTSPRRCRPSSPHLAGAPRARRAHRRRPAAHRRPRPRRSTARPAPAAAARAPTWRCSPAACCTSPSTEGLVDRRLRRRAAPPASTTSGRSPRSGWPERVERVTGVAVADAARRRRQPRARPAPPEARRLSSSPAAAPSSTRRHRHGDGLRSTSPSPLGLPGRPGSGYGASPARATARAGASTGRRPTSCPATATSTTRPPARTSRAVWGVDPADLPGPGRQRVRAARPLGTDGGPRALLVHGSQPRRLAPRTRAASPSASPSLDLLVVCDFVLSETAALADVVLPVTSGPRRRAP